MTMDIKIPRMNIYTVLKPIKNLFPIAIYKITNKIKKSYLKSNHKYFKTMLVALMHAHFLSEFKLHGLLLYLNTFKDIINRIRYVLMQQAYLLQTRISAFESTV